jgi:hypothetical protein
MCLLTAAFLSVPMLYVKQSHPKIEWLFNLGIVFLVGFLSITLFYWIATKKFYSERPLKTFISLYPRFLIVSMGLSLHNGLAVLEGFVGRKTPFVRTPKFNVAGGESWKNNSYVSARINVITIMEGFFCLYFILAIGLGFRLHDNGLLVFHAMLALGFGGVFFYSVRPAFHA